MTDRQTDRNSSIELLKILAIIIIVFSHAMPDGDVMQCQQYGSALDLRMVTHSSQMIILSFIHNMGQIGNDIFLVCSVWFLTESKTARLNKIISMIIDCFLVSVIMLCGFSLFGYKFRMTYFIKQFFPVTFGNSWFLTCYLLLYAIHPLLNIIIKNIKQKILFLVVALFIVLYCVESFVMEGKRFFYSELIGFCGIYFIVAYVKKYMEFIHNNRQYGVSLLLVGIVGWFFQNLVTDFVGLHLNFLANKGQLWNQFINPCYIMIAIGLFIISKNHTFISKSINYISSLSLLIYMFHCNRIVRDYFRFDFFGFVKNNYSYKHLLYFCIIYGFITLIFGVLLSFIYEKTIKKVANRIIIRLSDKIKILWEKFCVKFNLD